MFVYLSLSARCACARVRVHICTNYTLIDALFTWRRDARGYVARIETAFVENARVRGVML